MNVLTHFFTLFIIYSVYGISTAGAEIDSSTVNNDKTPTKEIAIIQLSFDGINTLHCGVGTVLQQTQKVLREFNQDNEDVHLKLYLITGDYSSQLPEYSKQILLKNQIDCRESGGEVFLIPIVKKNQMFGDPGQWNELCDEGAKLCSRIINDNAYTIIIAHDTAFAHIPIQLKHLHLGGDINQPYKVLWIPHATSWSYNGHTNDGVANWPERHQWELETFRYAHTYDYKIGYISPSIKGLVTSPPFDVQECSLFHYRTGILLDKYLDPINEKQIIQELEKRSIPLDKRLIFSIGRATPLKGLDITLEMYRQLKEEYSDIHLVMLAPPSDSMPSFLSILKQRVKNEQLDVTLIDEFDSELANYIYQWPKTAMVSLLSRMDTQPLTLMEARANPTNCVLLTSNPERIGKQVTHGVNGFWCPLENLDDIIDKPCSLNGPLKQIVDCARQILDLTADERGQIIEAGKALILEEYELRKNMKRNLENLLEVDK